MIGASFKKNDNKKNNYKIILLLISNFFKKKLTKILTSISNNNNNIFANIKIQIVKKTNKKLIYLFLILSTMAIQSQDINNKWAINIGFVGIKYYGDSDSNRGFVSAKQFPRISISRYTSKNITLSGAFSTSPNKTNKYTTFDGEIRYDFGASENIVSQAVLEAQDC